MNQFVFGQWTLEVDCSATSAAYAKIALGAPESCGCDPCLNYAASRDTTYPSDFLEFLAGVGVLCDREAEIYHNARLENGLHSFGGWFHCVGSIVSGSAPPVPYAERYRSFDLHRMTDRFSAGASSQTALVDQAFGSQSLIQIEFQAEVEWLLESPEPD